MFDSTSLPTVAQDDDGQLTTTSLIVAEGVDVQHKNILGLVRKHLADFEEFGGVAFETRVAGQSPNPTKLAVLNRDQALLLMTYLRNSAVVRDFKKRLIRAFTEMEHRLADGAQPQVPKTYAEALRAAADAVEQLEASEKRAREIEELRAAEEPKRRFADAVSSAKNNMLIGEFAKILRANGVPMGQQRLFQWLRDQGLLCRQRGGLWNTPTQRAMELGLFDVKETVVQHASGDTTVQRTPKLTGRGQVYLAERLLPDGDVEVA
ncbi:phage antirepressor KilAC domain-containing protein [Corynebacterium otitidis]